MSENLGPSIIKKENKTNNNLKTKGQREIRRLVHERTIIITAHLGHRGITGGLIVLPSLL